MNITLNNDTHRLPEEESITKLLEEFPSQKPNTVVSVNHRVICSRTWPDHILQEGDNVLIFELKGGG